MPLVSTAAATEVAISLWFMLGQPPSRHGKRPCMIEGVQPTRNPPEPGGALGPRSYTAARTATALSPPAAPRYRRMRRAPGAPRAAGNRHPTAKSGVLPSSRAPTQRAPRESRSGGARRGAAAEPTHPRASSRIRERRARDVARRGDHSICRLLYSGWRSTSGGRFETRRTYSAPATGYDARRAASTCARPGASFPSSIALIAATSDSSADR